MGVELERQTGAVAHGEDVAVDVGEGGGVFEDRTVHEDTVSGVVPRAEEVKAALYDVVKGEVTNVQVGADDAASVEVVQADGTCGAASEL